MHSLHNETKILVVQSQEQSHTETLLCRGSVDCTITAHTAFEGQKLDIFILCVAGADDTVRIVLDGNTAYPHSEVHIHCVTLIGNDANVHVEGGITIPQDVHGVNGTLMEENIILGQRCTLYTLPMLDVQSNDVQASHGATVHTLDAYKMFYLQSRGIDASEAQSVLIGGHISTILGEDEQYADQRALAFEYALQSV